MNTASILLLLFIAALTALALRSIRKHKLLGRCSGDCARCAMQCEKRK